MTIATQPHILIGSKGLARCRESARLAGATGEPTYNFLVVREEDIGMSPSDIPSSPVNASSFAYVVGIDIGSQSCDFCVQAR